MSLRDFTLVIILSALSLISSFGNILYFVFGVIILCVPARISYICSALISFLIYFSFGMQPHTLLNFIFLPMMVYLMVKTKTFTMSRSSEQSFLNIKLGMIGFLVSSIFTFLNIIINGMIVDSIAASFIRYLPGNMITIGLNTLLFLVLGNRICDFLKKRLTHYYK